MQRDGFDRGHGIVFWPRKLVCNIAKWMHANFHGLIRKIVDFLMALVAPGFRFGGRIVSVEGTGGMQAPCWGPGTEPLLGYGSKPRKLSKFTKFFIKN